LPRPRPRPRRPPSGEVKVVRRWGGCWLQATGSKPPPLPSRGPSGWERGVRGRDSLHSIPVQSKGGPIHARPSRFQRGFPSAQPDSPVQTVRGRSDPTRQRTRVGLHQTADLWAKPMHGAPREDSVGRPDGAHGGRCAAPMPALRGTAQADPRRVRVYDVRLASARRNRPAGHPEPRRAFRVAPHTSQRGR
jgi:hypothetical protein